MAESLHRSGVWERLPGSGYRKGRGSDEAGVRGSALLPILFSTRARADRADGQPSGNRQEFMEPMVAWRRTARRAIYECEPVNRCHEIVGVTSRLSGPISTTPSGTGWPQAPPAPWNQNKRRRSQSGVEKIA